AYGTASVGKVDRIVGPGNAWVAEAKRQVSSDVGIDAPAGPSEILIVADRTANPEAVARELCAQAEHDEDACVVALCVGQALADRVLAAVESTAPTQPRKAIVLPALASRGAVLVIDAVSDAWPFVEAFAPEHLFLALEDADASLPFVKNAGTVFVGHSASVAFGDYLTGANHVLPTAGAARRASGLSVTDFVRSTTWQRITPAGAAAMAPATDALAQSEGLFAHAAAARGHINAAAMPLSPSPTRPRRGLEAITRYVPKRPPCEVDLTDNTSLFGAPPSVANVLGSLASSTITRYPSPYGDELRAALGTAFDVHGDCIVTGDGSDDVLDIVTRAFGDVGDAFAFCPPTFSIVASFATANGLRPEACALDVDAIARKNPKIVYLCAPNNPTGAMLPEGFLDAVLAKTRALVLYDEAYADYSGAPSLLGRAATSDRLVVARTFSKAFGLAGLRVGWAVSSPAVIANLERARGPYKVGAVAEKAALAALSDRAWVDARVADVLALRARFVEALTAKGLAPLPSNANFVLVPVPGCEARADAMRAHGVSVRAFPKLAGVGDALRISIGPWPMMQACLAALEATG
ncbi:MAG: histidinol dehydrogenase, partial [Polyangiaceae bacterium]